MFSRLKVLTILLPALSAALPVRGQQNGDSLRHHYDRAEQQQRAGDLNGAASEYRAFLADALGELAMGYGLARDERHAAPLFDEALQLRPDSPSLLLNDARTEVMAGDPARAKVLATRFISAFPGDRARLALAHQVLGRALLKMNQDQAARKELEAAVALDPTFPNGYDLAVACLDLDDDKCAAQVFGEMEKAFGDTAEIHMAFGRAYGDSDFQPRAVVEFTKAIQESPRLPGAHYLLAAVELAMGDDETHVRAAEENLKKELLITPRDAMTYTALGEIAANHNNDAEAESDLKKALAIDPANPDTWLYLGQMEFGARNTVEAEKALRECIARTTDPSRNRYQVQKAHFLLGRILMQKGQQDAAHAEMQIARDLANRTLSQDKSKLAGLMDSSAAQSPNSSPGADFASPASTADLAAVRRVEALKQQITPAVADSYNNLGAIAASRADYPQAVADFARAAEWDPSLEGLDYNWGRAAFAGSLFADAIPPLTRYLKAHSDDHGARSVLGIAEFMVGSYSDCVATLQPIMTDNNPAPQVEYVYADSLIRTGQAAAGTERLADLERAHPEIPDVHRALAEAWEQTGNTTQAVEELRATIRLDPNDAAAHDDLGQLQLKTGDVAAAVTELESAVKLSPRNEAFHQHLAHGYQAALRPADAQREMNLSSALRARSQAATAPGAAAQR